MQEPNGIPAGAVATVVAGMVAAAEGSTPARVVVAAKVGGPLNLSPLAAGLVMSGILACSQVSCSGVNGVIGAVWRHEEQLL